MKITTAPAFVFYPFVHHITIPSFTSTFSPSSTGFTSLHSLSHVVSSRCRFMASSPCPYPSPAITTLSATATSSTTQRKELFVDAESRTYPIIFGPDLLNDPALFKNKDWFPGDKILIVTNTTIAPLYLARLKNTLKAADPTKKLFEVILPDGEEYKNMNSLNVILDKCLDAKLDRKSTLVALGGGVIGDITGFAAACFVRGVPFIQIPTTLLAVVDSSVGGKTAVNHPKGKNMIGAFYQPRSVLVDSLTLETLDDRQLAAGIAEIIKYGLICDAEFFEWLEVNIEKIVDRDPDAMQYAMERSCINKANVVGQDEKETGLRAILNLGHTFGHAIEASMGYGRWLHGEAVSAGMMMACEMSNRLGWLDVDVTKRAEKMLAKASLPVRPPPNMGIESFMMYMSVDKKVESGVLKLILLEGLGKAVVTSKYPESVLFDTIMHFQKLYKENPGQYDNFLGLVGKTLDDVV